MKMEKKASFTFFFLTLLLFTIYSFSVSAHSILSDDPLKSIIGQQNSESLKNYIINEATIQAQAPGPWNNEIESTLVLGRNRTRRRDILSHFHKYNNGWNITNKHYWASVAFTGATGFILAILWFISFGLALFVHLCFGWRITMRRCSCSCSLKLCLILLIIFTCAVSIGCILLSIGQNKFNNEALHTLNYVVNQSDYTVQMLNNVTEYLTLAKSVKVAQILLPLETSADIDRLNVDLNKAAVSLKEKTNESSGKISSVFNAIRLALISVAVVMLVVCVFGFVLSIFGHQHAIYIFVISGWLLVAVTFILCGVFVILGNAIGDTCVAMGEWVDNPEAETALSNILPCVDERTTNQSLLKSREIITDVINVANGFIYGYANINPTSEMTSTYFNQSGPLVPSLCYPYGSELQDRQCLDQEVSIANASTVYRNYICTVSESGICTSVGRLTPDLYKQLMESVNISYGLEHYAPTLLNLQNCNFVREAFKNITINHCPPLEHHLRVINAGLGLISVGVMLCLALWILYANRPQKEEVFAKLSLRIKGSCTGNGGASKGTTPINGEV